MFKAYAALIALCLCCHASASDDCYGFDRCLLANDPQVRKELSLSEAQQDEAKRILREYVEKRWELAKRASEERDDEKRARLPEEGERELQRIDTKIADTLDPSQRSRIREIAWRLLGVDAIFIEKHRQFLGISDAQYKSLSPRFDAYGLAFKKWRKSVTAQNSKPSYRAMGETEQQTLEAMLKELGPEVRQKYEEQGGKPIEFSKWEIKSSWSLGELKEEKEKE